jgi:uncharacterized protein YciI
LYFLALATDYDGTLAQQGAVEEVTLDALTRFKSTGRRLILVTGRELPHIKTAFPHLKIFDRVVAENGALIYDPATEKEQLIAPGPTALLVARLRELNVLSASVAAAGSFLGLPVDEDEGRGGHRPRLGTRLIVENQAIAMHGIPVGVGGCSLERLHSWGDDLAVLVQHFCNHELVLLGVGILDITNGALGLAEVGGHALVPLRADANRPFHRRVRPNRLLSANAAAPSQAQP